MGADQDLHASKVARKSSAQVSAVVRVTAPSSFA
jgi:hypothetical protein